MQHFKYAKHCWGVIGLRRMLNSIFLIISLFCLPKNSFKLCYLFQVKRKCVVSLHLLRNIHIIFFVFSISFHNFFQFSASDQVILSRRRKGEHDFQASKNLNCIFLLHANKINANSTFIIKTVFYQTKEDYLFYNIETY